MIAPGEFSEALKGKSLSFREKKIQAQEKGIAEMLAEVEREKKKLKKEGKNVGSDELD